ncbi:MAG: rod shape-determining protein MreC [Patescibacteria group bacterium]
MKYGGWLLLLLLGPIFFSNFFVGSKNQFLSLVSESLVAGDYDAAFVDLGNRRFLRAKIYSTYPFNHRNLIGINAGAREGVKEGMAVTVNGKILLGKITEVSPHFSLAVTLYDSSWSSPVRIGDKEIDALLVGGQEPVLTTIDKSETVKIGDSIYSASRDFPYGFKIGFIKNFSNLPTKTFQESGISFDYNFGSLREVLIFMGYAQ